MTVHRMLLDAAARMPGAVALSHEGRHVDYASLVDDSARVAGFLRDAGVRHGDRVALLLENSREYVTAYFGILRAGACCVALNHANGGQTQLELLRDSGAVALWSRDRHVPDPACYVAACPALRLVVLEGTAPVCASATGATFVSAGNALAAAPVTDAGTVGPDDLALILYTSGSTGAPRGVMLSHGNLVANTHQILAYLRLRSDDSVCCILPFHYSFGNSLLLTHVRCGGRVVVDNRFAFPQQVLATLADERCTGFSGVPSHYAILCARTDFLLRRHEHLRYLTQAGGAMSPELARMIREALPARIDVHVMYGQTEASARLASVPPDRLRDKYGSIGLAIPGVTLTVRRPDGSECDVHEPGEIVAAGPNVMRGYWNAPAESAAVLGQDGLRTGDVAYRDEDGFLYVVDRLRNMIKAGANRVGSLEIEATLLRHPAVAEACVIGVPDELLGEAIEAWVVPHERSFADEKLLLRHCALSLAAYKMPRRVRFVAALPRNSAGKVLKAALRETASRPE
ncbi:MAG: acyl--CoA ligase [bacterium]|nr:acyl--CoA ligase [bacterium]